MNWVSKSDYLPQAFERVLVFCPAYNNDDNLRYRIVNSEFVAMMSEVSHWAYIIDPE